MTKKNAISAVESIEKQIAELNALKDVVTFIEEQIRYLDAEAQRYEELAKEHADDGGNPEPYYTKQAKEEAQKANGFRAILDKLTK